MLELAKPKLTETWTTGGDLADFSIDGDLSKGVSGFVTSKAKRNGFAFVQTKLDATPFHNKRLQLAAECCTKNITGQATLFITAERSDGRIITYDNMLDRPFLGTNDWQPCELVIDVPSNVSSLYVGARVSYGAGTIQFRNFTLREVPSTVDTTDHYAFGCVGKWDLEPVNLDFSEHEYTELRRGRPYISPARRWVISSDGSDYAFERNRENLFDGKPSARVKSIVEPTEGYLYQHFAAANYRGKRLRFSAHIKTEDADKGAWLRVCSFGRNSGYLIWKYSEQSVRGTSDWTKLEIEFDVPVEAYVIDIGADLIGSGSMYLGGLSVEVLGDCSTSRSELLRSVSMLSPADEGWSLRKAKAVKVIPDRPGRGIRFEPSKLTGKSKVYSRAIAQTSYIPPDLNVTFSCLLRGTHDGQRVSLLLTPLDADKKQLKPEFCEEISLSKDVWSQIQQEFIVPEGTESLNVSVSNLEAHELYLTQPSLL